MGEEKKITGSKNVILCVISILILCVLMFPLFWTLITSSITVPLMPRCFVAYFLNSFIILSIYRQKKEGYRPFSTLVRYKDTKKSR